MAAFVVVSPTGPPNATRGGERLNIFPGSATPSVYAAETPFWIGYGFVADASGEDVEASVADTTGFELLVDGRAVELVTEIVVEGRRTVRKFAVADFPQGLPAGWHVFLGRWYHAGVLALTSERSVEFVER